MTVWEEKIKQYGGIPFMSAKEIEAHIKKQYKWIERRQGDIETARYDIKSTREAIAFWKKELKKLKGKK